MYIHQGDNDGDGAPNLGDGAAALGVDDASENSDRVVNILAAVGVAELPSSGVA